MNRLSLFSVILCVVSVFTSCNAGTTGSMQEDAKDSAFEWVGEYQSDVDGILQVLKVRLLFDELFFDYAFATGDGGSCYLLSGKAILKVGDLEWDDDDEDVAYAVDEYVYDSACYMAIRIEADSHRRARIVTDDERVWKLVGENAATMMLME